MPTKATAGSEGVDESGEEDEVPSWLRELGASISAERGTGELDSIQGATDVPDWLQDLRASLPDESVPEAPEAEEPDQVPAWLSDLPAVTKEPVPGPPVSDLEVAKREVPDWLDELRPAAEEGEVPAPPEFEPAAEEEEVPVPPELEPVAGEGEVPDWLAELRPAAEEAEVPAPPEFEPVAEEGEVPDWLDELRPAAEEGEVPAPPEFEPVAEEGKMPDWLAELRPAAEEEEMPAPPELEPLAEEGKMPDWLADLRPAAEEEEVPAPPELEPAAEEGEVPDWLTGLKPAAAEAGEAIEEAEEEIEAATMPSWLAELKPAAAEAGEAVEEAEEGIEAATVPSWLAELQEEEDQILPPLEESLIEAELPDWLVPAEPGFEEAETLARAEIPEWLLALKPHELRAEEGEELEVPAPIVEEVVEETGLLAGIPGTLPVEMAIAQPRAAAVVEVEPLVADTPEARLFAEIVARPPETAPQVIEQPKAGLLDRLPWLVVYIMLIALVAVPLLLGEPLLIRNIDSVPGPIADLHGEIAALGNDAPVLVAFDYDPASIGELDPLAEVIVGHLMDQDARVVVVSLLPAGPATAQRLLEKLTAERPGYASGYGEQYANLGYLAGQAAGVRLVGGSLEIALPRDFQGTPVGTLPIMQGLDSLQDFDLVIELAAGQDTLRWWIEQGSMPYSVPLGAGTSASIEPTAKAYYETEPRQLVGLVSGVPGAAMYDAVLSGQQSLQGTLAARLDSQLAGHLIFILVILVGNGVYLVRRGTGEER